MKGREAQEERGVARDENFVERTLRMGRPGTSGGKFGKIVILTVLGRRFFRKGRASKQNRTTVSAHQGQESMTRVWMCKKEKGSATLAKGQVAVHEVRSRQPSHVPKSAEILFGVHRL